MNFENLMVDGVLVLKIADMVLRACVVCLAVEQLNGQIAKIRELEKNHHRIESVLKYLNSKLCRIEQHLEEEKNDTSYECCVTDGNGTKSTDPIFLNGKVHFPDRSGNIQINKMT